MRRKDLPEIIFFEEKVGSNGIHCLDYKNSSNIKYIREDVVKNISSKPVLVGESELLLAFAKWLEEDTINGLMAEPKYYVERFLKANNSN